MRGSTSLAACVALLPLAGTLRLTPRAPAAHVARAPRRHRTAVAAADAPDDDDVPVGGLINPSDVASLSARIAKIQQTGLATPAQKLFELATAQPPQLLLRDFFRRGESVALFRRPEPDESESRESPTDVGEPRRMSSSRRTSKARCISSAVARSRASPRSCAKSALAWPDARMGSSWRSATL